MPYTVDKLPNNITRFLDQPDDDCHKSKHVAVMLYSKC